MKYSFDVYELDSDRMVLRRRGRRVSLEPQVFAVLEVLVRNHGTLITREQLLAEVWLSRNVSPSVVDNRISAARLAIGDDGKTQRFIKTLTNQGFQFVGNVVESDQEEGPAELSDAPAATGPAAVLLKRPNVMALGLVFAVVLSGLLFVAYQFAAPGSPATLDSSGEASVIPTGENASAPLERRVVIAVLPAETNGAAEVNLELCAAAVAEEAIAFLGAIEEIEVISRASAFGVRTRGFSTDEIDEVLGVKYRVETRCQQRSERADITVQLIDADSELILWSKRYQFSDDGVQQNQEQLTVAANVSLSVANTLGLSASSFSPNVISNIAAQDYLTARGLLELRTPEKISEAIDLFQSVVEVEPDYMPAYAGLFDAYWADVNYGSLSLRDNVPRMKRVLRQMQILGPDTPEALTAEGILIPIDGREDRHVEMAIELLNRAIETGPNYALAYRERASILEISGRFEEGLNAYQEALRLDPVSVDMLAGLSWVYYNLGDLNSAIATARRNIRWNEGNPVAQTAMARLLMATNEQEQALALLRDVLEEQPSNFAARWNISWLYRSLGAYELSIASAPHEALKAISAATAGNKELAKEYADILPGYLSSKLALYFVGDADHLIAHIEEQADSLDFLKTDNLNPNNIYTGTLIAAVLDGRNDDLLQFVMTKLATYYETHDHRDLATASSYAAALSYAVLQDDFPAAIEIFEEANAKGLVFLHTLTVPHLEAFRAQPEFAVLEGQMKRRAEAILTASQPAHP